MVNNYIVTYLLCSFLSLILGLLAAANGLWAARRWESAGATEEQYRLEKRVYLIMTLMICGLGLRLLMVPLWFATLQSLLGSIPGAMCLTGVHNCNTPYSYLASGLKLLLPPFYGFWLLLNALDRQLASQPFLRQKLLFLAPLGILLIGESLLDAYFFLSVPYRQVSCCSSLLDLPKASIAPTVTHAWNGLALLYALLLFIGAEILYCFQIQKRSAAAAPPWWFGNKVVMLWESALIVATFSILIYLLDVTLSPLFLHRPEHHCIFCLGQEVWDVLGAVGMIFLGLLLLLIYFWSVSLARYRDLPPLLTDRMTRLLAWSGTMLAAGTIILSLHLLFVL